MRYVCVCAVAFRIFDTGETGYVTEEDLVHVLEKGAGSSFSSKQLHMVRHVASTRCSLSLCRPVYAVPCHSGQS